jgi:hypothetical protein
MFVMGWAGASLAAPCAGFTDVDSTSAFCGNVTWIKNRGVTLGCTATQYCPNEPTTRLQMAAFMNRLGEALFPSTCAAGQVMKWDGLEWGCASDNIGGSGGGGTVTRVAAGTGLAATPNPVVGAGVISVASSYRLPQACGAGQVPKWNGSAWACAADASGGGTVTSVTTGTALTGGVITATGTVAADTTYLQRGVSGVCAAGSSIRTTNADGTVACEADDVGSGGSAGWLLAGNAATNPATQFLGTTDNKALGIRVNNAAALRVLPALTSPNLVGGNALNSVSVGVRGATIGGGGAAPGDTDPDFTLEGPNVVTDAYGTVGGGYNNRAGDNANSPVDRPFATVAGGAFNVASGTYAAIGGGGGNQAQDNYATVAGGAGNVAQGRHGSVGGGLQNNAKAFWSTVGGGAANVAGGATSVSGTYSTVAGGLGNTAFGQHSTVGGGSGNDALLADSTVGGARVNQAGGEGSTVGGRVNNSANGSQSTVGGGFVNLASGFRSTVSGGRSNQASGDYSTVIGGEQNRANGAHSVAMGSYAVVNGAGSFLFVDGSGSATLEAVTTDTPNEFVVVATGGIAMSTTRNFTNLCRLSPGGGSWACSSDRRVKRDFATIDTGAILRKVVALPIPPGASRPSPPTSGTWGRWLRTFARPSGWAPTTRPSRKSTSTA